MIEFERLERLQKTDLPILELWLEDAEVLKRMDGMLPLDEWYENTSRNDMYYTWLAYIGEQPIGTVIIELDEESAYIGIITNPALRYKGYGKALISEVMKRPELQAVTKWVASIEEDNVPCLACFSALGYVQEDLEPDEDGFLELVYERERETG